MNMGTSNGGMNRGLVVFMTTPNNLVGGTLTPSPLHKHNSVDPSMANIGVYLLCISVASKMMVRCEVEVVTFQKSLLVVTDSLTILATMERLFYKCLQPLRMLT